MENYNLPLYRSWFPFLSTGKIWMNHAAVSPMSSRVRAAVDEYLRRAAIDEIDTFPSSLSTASSLKRNLAALINGAPERIAFCGNTSEGLSLLASGLDWRAGDRIILNDQEFPSNVVPFINLKRLGVEVDFVRTRDGEVTPAQIEALITPRTKVVSISFVQFLSGYRADLAAIGELCKRKNIIFSVDAIQGLGVSPLDVRSSHIGFLSCGGPKWLMGMLGLGFIYISGDVQERIRQSHAGWMSNRNYFGDFLNYRIDFDETARRYENGTQNLAGIVALETSTSTLLEVGIPSIANHVGTLADGVIMLADEFGCDLVTPRERGKRAGIVTFRCSNAAGFFDACTKANIAVSLREGMIRVAPHFYNSIEEVGALRAIMADHRKSAAA